MDPGARILELRAPETAMDPGNGRKLRTAVNPGAAVDPGTALLPETLWIQELCGSWNCADPETL